jgi:protoporphyrin/coproporphyrin ferrochelatase
MKIGVILLNFGEPREATMEAVVPFLERIFSLNAPLMGSTAPSRDEVVARSRQLAEARAPGLIAEYEEIGGSPLHRQATEQAEALQLELRKRGHEASVRIGMQFTDPLIENAVRDARADEIDHLVPIAVYPLCGPSTTVAALSEVDRQLVEQGWSVPCSQVSGWHRHPDYLQVRAAAIQRLLYERGLSFSDPRTRLVFSAHGTPIKYLEEGSRYDAYVREFCAAVANQVGAGNYLLGYQNHTNRPGVQWTQPDIDKVVAEVDADRIVVDAVSFMHEQSETLAELDVELREQVEERGIEFYRVPIPWVDPLFISMLADLVEAGVASGSDVPPAGLHQCRCKATPGTWCTNGAA